MGCLLKKVVHQDEVNNAHEVLVVRVSQALLDVTSLEKVIDGMEEESQEGSDNTRDFDKEMTIA